MMRYPLGSGGKRVCTRPPYLFVFRSSTMMSRMKFEARVSGTVTPASTTEFDFSITLLSLAIELRISRSRFSGYSAHGVWASAPSLRRFRLDEVIAEGLARTFSAPSQTVSQLSQNLVLELIFENAGEIVALELPGSGILRDLPWKPGRIGPLHARHAKQHSRGDVRLGCY